MTQNLKFLENILSFIFDYLFGFDGVKICFNMVGVKIRSPKFDGDLIENKNSDKTSGKILPQCVIVNEPIRVSFWGSLRGHAAGTPTGLVWAVTRKNMLNDRLTLT